jgi:hypothetical protein
MPHRTAWQLPVSDGWIVDGLMWTRNVTRKRYCHTLLEHYKSSQSSDILGAKGKEAAMRYSIPRKNAFSSSNPRRNQLPGVRAMFRTQILFTKESIKPSLCHSGRTWILFNDPSYFVPPRRRHIYLSRMLDKCRSFLPSLHSVLRVFQ